MGIPTSVLSAVSAGIPLTTQKDSLPSANSAPDRVRPRVASKDPTRTIDYNKSTGILSFPVDRPKYYISFAFEEYRRPSMFEGLSSNGLTDYISLPMPNSLIDSSTFDYQAEKGDLLIDAAAQEWQDQADAYKTGGVGGIASTFNNIGQTISRAGEAALGTSIRGLKDTVASSSAIGNTVVSGAMQIMGLADNPFMTVQFKGAQFKTHRFSWRLSPRSEQETKNLDQIVNTFKRVAHPELLTAGAGGFYKFPYIVWPKFNPEGAMSHMYKFKPCVITSIVANWSPNDRPAFFAKTEAPVDMILEISLLEIELWRGGGEFLEINTGDFNSTPKPPVRNLGKV